MSIAAAIQSLASDAIAVLQQTISAEPPLAATSHRTLIVSGWSDAAAIPSIASYLVALRASAINQAGRITTDTFEDDSEELAAIAKSVREITDPPSGCGDVKDWKSKYRNAWIAEGLWHCCMRLAMDDPSLHLTGPVLAVDFSHIDPKDHGFDIIALHARSDDDLVGMSFIETKAYATDYNKAMSDALVMHKAIDAGRHDTRIRQRVISMKPYVPIAYTDKIKSSLWKERRVHVPNPHYGEPTPPVDWTTTRPACAAAAAPVVIMPNPLADFAAFFDGVADGMLSALEVLEASV